MKKIKTIAFLLTIIINMSFQKSFAGTGAWPKGPDVYIMKPNLLFKGGDIKIMTGDTTLPTSGTIDAELGSAYVQKGTGTWYKKTDNGNTTNWQNFIFGALGTSGNDDCLPRWDGNGSGILQNSDLCVDDAGNGTGLNTLSVGDLLLSGSELAVSGTGNLTLATSGAGAIVLATSITPNLPLKIGAGGEIESGLIDLTLEVDGILPNLNGGTGTSATDYVDLAVNVNGILPIANGGTGTSTTQPVDLSNVIGVLGFANGGTSSTFQNFVDLTTSQTISGVKTFTDKLATSSTTTASIPCPAMTEAQRDLIAAPEEGDCVFNTDTDDFSTFNGITWSANAPPAGLTSFIYGEDLLAGDPIQIYDDAGTAKVKKVSFFGTGPETITPSDGSSWTSSFTPSDRNFTGIAYGNGVFVAVAANGIISEQVMTSPDGITWTTQTIPLSGGYQAVTFGGGLFVAVNSSGAAATAVMTSPDGINWTNRVASAGNIWQSVTYGGGLFVAVSQDGANQVMTSPDGITWTGRVASSSTNWNDVTYGGGLFVAVSGNGVGIVGVMTSPDGITWTARTESVDNSWRTVAYGNGVFVATGNATAGDDVMTSPDGITWTSRTESESNNWDEITFGGGLFVVVAQDGTNRVMTSPDGITWTSYASAVANTWRGVTYGNGAFVAISSNGTNNRAMLSAATATAGEEFTTLDFVGIAQTTAVSNTSNPVALLGQISTIHSGETAGAISYVQPVGTISSAGTIQPAGKFISDTELLVTNTPELDANINFLPSYIYGEDITSGTPVQLYTDGGTEKVKGLAETVGSSDIWTSRTASSLSNWQSITYGNGLFVAVGPSAPVMTSPDGIVWTTRTAAATLSWTGVTYGNGLFVAVAASGTDRVMTSTDGITWTLRTAGFVSSWTDVTYGNGLFVAVADTGTDRVMTSPDGISWTSRSASEASNWFAVTYGNGVFVAVATGGTNLVMTSPDGIAWTSRSAVEDNDWVGIGFGNGVFVATAAFGGTTRLMYSTDGITWNAVNIGTKNWYGVTYGNGIFVLSSGSSGADSILTSPDGIVWTGQVGTEFTSDVVFGNDIFVTVGSFGSSRVSTSPAGGFITTVAPENFFGVAQTTAVSNTFNPVAVKGKTSTIHVGETVGATSYIQTDGTLGSTVTAYPVGVYTSSTDLLLDSGVSTGTQYQRKTITSSTITAAGVVSDLTFNNLEIGKTYRVSGSIVANTTSVTTAASWLRYIFKGASPDEAFFIKGSTSETATSYMLTSPSFIFTAIGTTLTFEVEVLTNCHLTIAGATGDNFIILEELPNHEKVSKW